MDVLYTIEEVQKRLEKFCYTHEASKEFAEWASKGSWYFTEEMDDESQEGEFLRDLFGDIEAQWEMLLGDAFYEGGKEAVSNVILREDYITNWLSQILSFLSASKMLA